MKITVRHDPEERWGFRTPIGMVWVSAWGNGPVELDKYHTTQGHYGVDVNHESYKTLRKMFSYAKYKII